MSIDRGEERRADSMNVSSPVRYMIQSTRIAILFSKTKVYDVDQVSSVPDTHDKISRFDISMHERVRVDKFDARDLGRKKLWSALDSQRMNQRH